MILLNGRKISDKIKMSLCKTIKDENLSPGLGIILMGNRPDSKLYVTMKKRACEKVGIKNIDVIIDENSSEDDLIKEIIKMNNNSEIHGILIQLPLPKHIDQNKVLSMVSLEKDVDGFHVKNMGNLTLNRSDLLFPPCTPAGCMELLKHYNIEIEGKHAVIIGKSNIVGLPLSLMLLHEDATVTIWHYKTKNLKEHTRNADILVAACGVPNYITKEYLKPGVVVIDIGINRLDDGSLVGDVDFDAIKDKASAITPVPGGVGPMTIATLLENTLIAYRQNLWEVF